MADKKREVDRRLFVQGSALAGAFAFLGGSLPIFGAGTQAGQLDPSKVTFSIDEQTQLLDGQEIVASTSFPDPKGGTVNVRMFLRNVEAEPNFTIIFHSTLTTPSGQVFSNLLITSGTRGPVDNGYRNITVSHVSVKPDGTITRQSPKTIRASTTDPYGGMSPLQMFQQMLKNKQSGKPPVPREQP
jgi:hypothetical protein